jgi:hypothetical protein
MITTAMHSVLKNASALQTRDHYLYLVGDEEAVLYIGILTHQGDTNMGTDPLRKNRDKNASHKLEGPQSLHLLLLFPASDECNNTYPRSGLHNF